MAKVHATLITFYMRHRRSAKTWDSVSFYVVH
ncbi:hypothetical protein BSTP6_001 [Bacillus phage BSTP6]|uniref:Uncharacterized protein n=2 Tax=Salasvirus phi29 TaxID=10756 RepID=A0A889INE9_9CAUD|nr:hypothetical protein BSTP6_001 [Bacillus phage BSTP6]CAA24473.1 unnamed protein product [Bacillus phage phi29]